MTAPARTRTPAARTGTTEREHFPPSTATKQGSAGTDTATRRRSAAAERAYARREQRRAHALHEDVERRDRRQPLAEPQRQRARQPAAKRLQERVTSSRAPLVVGVMVLLATGLAATLWLAIAAVSGSYQLQQAQAQVNALNDEKQQLLQQNSDLDSTPELQKRAVAQGMVPAPEPAHLVPQPDGSVAVVGQPKAAQPRPPSAAAGN